MIDLRIVGATLQGRSVDVDIAAGRIAAIRPTDPATAAPDAIDPVERTIDARGLHLLASLRNGHTHVAMSLFRGWGDGLPLMEWLETRIWPAEAKLRPEHVRAGARLSIVEMIRSGTTFFNDMYWHLGAIADAVQETGVRALLGSSLFDQGDEAVGRKWRRSVESDLERRSGFGDLVGMSIAPHAIYTVSEANLRWAADTAEREEVPLHIHLSETAGEVDRCVDAHGCRPAELLDRCRVLGPNTIVAHGNHLDRAEMTLLADRGTTLVHNPCANLKLATGAILDHRAARDVGLRVVIGTDGVASNNNHDLFEELKFASLLQKHRATDATALPADQAWAMATTEPARAFGHGSGTVVVGEAADLILVDPARPALQPGHDLESDLVYSANGSCVHTTICNGRVLMHERRVEVVDEAEVIDTAVAAAREVAGGR